MYVLAVSLYGQVDFIEFLCSSVISFVKIVSGFNDRSCQLLPLSALKHYWQTDAWWPGTLPVVCFTCKFCTTATVFVAVFWPLAIAATHISVHCWHEDVISVLRSSICTGTCYICASCTRGHENLAGL